MVKENCVSSTRKLRNSRTVRKWRKTIKRKWRNSPTASIRQKKKIQVWFRALILTDESMKETPRGKPPPPPKNKQKQNNNNNKNWKTK